MNCQKLYTKELANLSVCDKAKIFIDFHGEVKSSHMLDKPLSAKNFIKYLSNEGLSVKNIYWKMWAATISLSCS